MLEMESLKRVNAKEEMAPETVLKIEILTGNLIHKFKGVVKSDDTKFPILPDRFVTYSQFTESFDTLFQYEVFCRLLQEIESDAVPSVLRPEAEDGSAKPQYWIARQEFDEYYDKKQRKQCVKNRLIRHHKNEKVKPSKIDVKPNDLLILSKVVIPVSDHKSPIGKILRFE